VNYEIICNQCRAAFFVRGHEESDTNALVLNGARRLSWRRKRGEPD